MSRSIIPLVLLFMANFVAYSQDLDLFFTANLEVIDSLDPQKVTTRGYLLDNELFYDKPNLIRLQNGEFYHLNFTFTFKEDERTITHKNFEQEKHELLVAVDDTSSFAVKTVSNTPKGIAIYGIAGKKNDKWSMLTVTLLDRKRKVLGVGIFQMVYQSDLDPTLGFTQFMYEKTRIENLKVSTNKLLDEAHKKLLEPFKKPDVSFRIKN